VYKELFELYGTESPISAPVKYEDLQHMNYLDCIIREPLRLFPTIPLIGRQLTEDLKIGMFFFKPANVTNFFEVFNRNKDCEQI